ncbi:Ig-like domain-containing protein [Alcaligenes faecalis]|uniref:Ig-like domain-containing protein n=1 Tax=Alcaligenes faecalis TaxID=511 RepID=UPI0014859A24|nr:Ig-like domain-containing protein [Alcaligenes faecalis]
MINKAESESDVTITGTVGKDVKAGDTVTVTVNGKDYTTTVNADGKTWNVDVPGTEPASALAGLPAASSVSTLACTFESWASSEPGTSTFQVLPSALTVVV